MKRCMFFVALTTVSIGACRSSDPEPSSLTSSAAVTSTGRDSTNDEISPTDPLPPGVLTSAAHSDEWKIKNALSAAPATIAENATVRDRSAEGAKSELMSSGGRVLRRGTNGWTCLPDTPGRPQHDPMCMDETMMKWMDATAAGRKAEIDRVGLSYMLLGEVRADANDLSASKPPPGKDWIAIGPHVMVVVPDACRDAFRDVNQDITTNEPYVSSVHTPSSPLLIIPVAKGGERIKAYLPEGMSTF